MPPAGPVLNIPKLAWKRGPCLLGFFAYLVARNDAAAIVTWPSHNWPSWLRVVEQTACLDGPRRPRCRAEAIVAACAAGAGIAGAGIAGRAGEVQATEVGKSRREAKREAGLHGGPAHDARGEGVGVEAGPAVAGKLRSCAELSRRKPKLRRCRGSRYARASGARPTGAGLGAMLLPSKFGLVKFSRPRAKNCNSIIEA